MTPGKLILSVCGMAVLLSCKNPKPVAQAATPEPAAQPAPVVPANAVIASDAPMHEELQTENYDLIISFISIGEGIDYKEEKLVMDAIAERESKMKKEVIKEEVRWGREGEKDICIRLTDFSDKEKTEFIQSIRSSVKNERKLITFEENAQCRHKRK